MPEINSVVVSFIVALGIGLLIGAERERRKGEGPSPAGIRTFAITSLAGAIALKVGGELLLAMVTIGVFALSALAYWRTDDDDPGLTSEVALVVTILLGGLSVQQPALAAGLGVTIAILLAARVPLHHFVRSILTESEMMDALTFAAATLVVLPLLPNRDIGPYGALNLYKIWIVVIIVIGISGAGYMATRLLGSRYGLPISGLASGFISSIATIGAMGARTMKNPTVLRPAAAGAVLSTVATIIQLTIVLTATSLSTLRAMLPSLIFSLIMALAYGAAFTLGASRETEPSKEPNGHAFSFPKALLFATILSVVLLASAALQDWFGENGVMIAAAVTGFADAHSAAISVASLVSSEKISSSAAVLPILIGLSTNTISKLVVAAVSGGRQFATRVIPGLVLVLFAAWAGSLVGGLPS